MYPRVVLLAALSLALPGCRVSIPSSVWPALGEAVVDGAAGGAAYSLTERFLLPKDTTATDAGPLQAIYTDGGIL